MRIVFTVLLLWIHTATFAQTVTGKVLDATNGAALSGVTVYISNSSRSTTTDSKGVFTIEGFNSSYELVFSLVGYHLVSLTSDKLSKNPIEVKLSPKEHALDPVAVQSYEKDGWNKWGRLFLDDFIGTLPFSDQCVIKNKDMVKFRFSRKKNILDAIALEPLTIVNDYLGYQIRYDLVAFQVDFNTHFVFYAGYPVFSNISNGKHYLKVRSKRRAEVYTGSMLHFMRALYSDSLAQQGFQVRRMKKIPNFEKQRADSIFKANMYVSIQPDGKRIVMDRLAENFPRDSVNYYKAMRRQPDILNVLGNQLLSAKDLFVKADTVGNTYEIKDYLYITYPTKLEMPEYYTGKMNINGDSCVTAIVSLMDTTKLQVSYNGQYIPPTSVLAEAYWSWSEKISSMLPFDYKKD
ncbi:MULTISPECIES: carboxypeptidase-like regulatory domain-containing protein [Chitinophagaceae]